MGATTRKTWTATRRSFFKRRKGGRSSSRESSAAKELASFSDMASLNYSDSGALHEVEPQINSYVRVERLDYMVTRPVLIIGPLNDVVTDKLISDFPHKFSKCEPKLMNLTQEALEKGIMNNVIVDFKRRGSQFECYTLAGIKEICERVSFSFIIFSINKSLIGKLFVESALHCQRAHGCAGKTAPKPSLSHCASRQVQVRQTD